MTTQGRRLLLASLAFVWALTVTFAVLGTVLLVKNWSLVIPGIWGIRGFEFVLPIIFTTVGSVVIWKQPRNPLGWILAISGGLLTAIQGYVEEYAANALLVEMAQVPGALFAAWVAHWIWVPIVGTLSVYVFLLFPDGRLLTPRWRIVAWLGGVGIALTTITLAIFPGQLTSLSTIRNPYAVESLGPLAETLLFESSIQLLLMLSLVVAAASLIPRYRRADHEVRQQLKWLAASAILAAIAFPLQAFVNFRPLELLFLATLAAIPVAIGIAILRYRLYDIDVIINRTLVYGLLSAALALLYFGMVAVLQTLFVGLTGQESPLAVVVSTLLIAALFTPLRRRLQDFIDRRFYRKKYDAQQTLENFGQRMRDEVDVDHLQQALLSAIEEAFQPEQVRLWLRQTEVRGPSPDDPKSSSVAIS